MNQKTAVIYARVSSAKQAEEELPISSQLEQCRQKAEALGANVIKVYTDEGISGRSDSRPAFQDAILFCETEEPDYLITWSSSRFARNKVDAGFYKKRVSEANVKIVYVSMEVDTDTTGGWLLDGVMEIFDELYSRQVSADTRRSLMKNAKEGYWNGGRLPFGFIAVPAEENPKRKRLQPNPDEVFLIKKIFELKAYKGMGANSLVRWLNENGYRNRTKKWVRSTIHNLLRNESVIGLSVFGRRNSERVLRPRSEWIIINSHKPIIDRELWDIVQSKMDAESHPEATGSPHSRHYFTGMLKCGECGAQMHTEHAHGRSRSYWYYNCSASAKFKRHKPRRISSGVLDRWLLEVVASSVFSINNLKNIVSDLYDISVSWMHDKDQRIIDIGRKITSLKLRQNNLYELLELHGLNAPNLGDLAERLKNNNESLKVLEQEKAIIEAEHPPVVKVDTEMLEAVSGYLIDVLVSSKDPKKVRDFLASFIDHIEIRNEDVEIVYNPEKLLTGASAPVLSEVVWLPDLDSNQGQTD